MLEESTKWNVKQDCGEGRKSGGGEGLESKHALMDG